MIENVCYHIKPTQNDTDDNACLEVVKFVSKTESSEVILTMSYQNR